MFNRFVVTIVAIGLIYLTACTQLPQVSQTKNSEGDTKNLVTQSQILRFGANAADLKSLDPHKATTTNDRAVADMVFNGLVRFEPGNPANLEPDLALTLIARPMPTHIME